MTARQLTPDSFARLLGLPKSNFQAWTPKLPAKRQCDQAFELFTFTMCMKWTAIERRAFSEEFAALYYPQLLRLYNELPLDFNSDLFALLTSLICWQGGFSTGGRYLREHREETCSHWATLLERIAAVPEELVKHPKRTDDFSTDTFQGLLLLFKVLIQNAHLFIPEDQWYPPPSTDTLQKLQARLPLFQSLLPPNPPSPHRQGVAAWNAPDFRMARYLVNVIKNGGRLSAESLTVTGPFCWMSCELGGFEDESREACEGRCVEGGEAMRACARCRAVRYCSREHQKQDWKRHKQFCFPPAW